MGKNKENLIYHKKKLYYLLSHANPDHLLDSEVGILNLLQDDIELQAELSYDFYMKGE